MPGLRALLCLAFVAITAFAGATAAQAKRVALVVGINRYEHLPTQLQKAVNDARSVHAMLLRLGFAAENIVYGEDVDLKRLRELLAEFARKLSPGDMAFVFYSGHGFQLSNANLLLPGDTPRPTLRQGGVPLDVQRRQEEERIAHAALGEADIHRVIRNAGAEVGIVVLDACRNNPLTIAEQDNPFRDAHPGELVLGKDLGRVDPPMSSTLLLGLYSAERGQRALDRLSATDRDPNSPFTRVLVQKLTRPGTEIRSVVVDLQSEVYTLAKDAGFEQAPAYYDQLRGRRIYLAGPPAAPSPAGSDAPPAPAVVAMQSKPALPAAPESPATAAAPVTSTTTSPGEADPTARCQPVPPTASSAQDEAAIARVDQDWRRVMDSRTSGAIDQFLSQHAESWRGCWALAARADLRAFEQAGAASNAIAALETYLKRPRPMMEQQARARIAALRDEARRADCREFARAAAADHRTARGEGCTLVGEHWDESEDVQRARCHAGLTPDDRVREVGLRAADIVACRDTRAEAKAFGEAKAIADAALPKAQAKPRPVTIVGEGAAGKAELARAQAEIAALRKGLSALDGFLGAWLKGQHAADAAAAKVRIEAALATVLAAIRAVDDETWATAERAPFEIKGYEAYRTVLPEGWQRAKVDAVIADLTACNAAIDADDVDLMKAYRETFAEGRCTARLAALMASPTDLTGARLVVLSETPEETRVKAAQAAAAKVEAAKAGKRIPTVVGSVVGRVEGLLFDGDAALIVARGTDLWRAELPRGTVMPETTLKAERVTPAAIKKTTADADIHMIAMVIAHGSPVGIFDPSSSRYRAVLSGGSGIFTYGRTAWAWIDDRSSTEENGNRHQKLSLVVEDAGSSKVLREFPIKEQNVEITRLALSPDGKWLAAIVDWSEGKCSATRNPITGVYMAPFTDDCWKRKSAVRLYDVTRGALAQTFDNVPQSVAAQLDGALDETGNSSKSKEAVTGLDFTDDNRLILLRPTHISVLSGSGKTSNEFTRLGYSSAYSYRAFQTIKNVELLVGLRDGTFCYARDALHPAAASEACLSFSAGEHGGPNTMTVSPNRTIAASADSANSVHLWHIATRRYLGWLNVLPNGGYVVAKRDGAFTASDAARPYLAVAVGKRRWPLAEVPAFAERFLRSDAIDLFANLQ